MSLGDINKKALTLVEIIVSVVILALVITGLANVFVAGKRYIQHSRMRMAGGELGKEFLDPLQAYVRQDTWDGGANFINVDAVSKAGATVDDYVSSYDIKALDLPAANIRKVKVTIKLPNID